MAAHGATTQWALTIYADRPVPREVQIPGGAVWRNVTTEAKSKVAETLDEFRGNYLYNLMDENVRRFNAEVPQLWQWGDHEAPNNWSPGLDLESNNRYTVKDIRVLVRRARQAFLEYAPLRFESRAPRIHRRIAYGPLLDVFVLDLASFSVLSGRIASGTWYGLPPMCITPRRISTTPRKRSSPNSIRFGSSWPVRSTPERSAPAPWTTRSGLKSFSKNFRGAIRRTARPLRECNSLAKCGSTAGRGASASIYAI